MDQNTPKLMTGMEWEVARLELGPDVVGHMSSAEGPRMIREIHIDVSLETGTSTAWVDEVWIDAAAGPQG